ncbi:MAG: DUF4157 domain-containing protein [Deltaproteobacteria bacterium]|nr:DUF4157 domain-containing protein [Deltaproteobacteria bacterium]
MHVDGAGVSDVRSLMAAGGNVQMAALSSPVQRHGGGGDTAGVHDAAAHGIAGGGGAMPHGDTIQKAFGGHDISGISAHVGGRAAEANAAMGAEAYATGTNVAFKAQPDLHTAAHEAAHIVQQRSGVSLAGGVGQVGDSYEQHADKVADAVVAGKSAEGLLGPTPAGGGGDGGVQKRAVQRATTPGGVTDGRVTLDDHAQHETGAGAGALDTAGATTQGAQYDARTLEEWAKAFGDAQAARSAGAATDQRGKEAMLAAIAANTAPRYIARCGPKTNFTDYNSFGNGRRAFIFATEPADLIGCTPIEAMVKVGWTKEWIEKEVGKPISVCILDTHKSVAAASGAGGADGTAQVTTQKFEWPQLTTRAMADSDLLQSFTDDGTREITALLGASPAPPAVKALMGEILEVCSKTPPRGTPATSDANKSSLAVLMRTLLSRAYGANELYSGMGATISEQGELGAREVMVNNNGTNFALTSDNHRLVDIGAFTAADVQHALTPPPTR